MTRRRPQPMTTDADMMAFVQRTVAPALRDQTWLWLTDPDSPGFGTVLQIDHDTIGRLVPEPTWQAVVQIAGAELGLLYERRGPETLSATDRQRLRSALREASDRGLRVRGPVLVHDTGARWLGPDDLGGQD